VSAVWDGITQASTLKPEAAQARNDLADAARDYQWQRVVEIVIAHRGLVNCARLGGSSLYAPLHQAAHGGASPDVIRRLIEVGAWRTLRNASGERPADVAVRRGHAQLSSLLEPEYKRRVPMGILLKIQQHVHEVIRERAAEIVDEHALRLPELEPLLELEQPEMWFAVPGMYGGFSFRLEADGVEAVLISESWSRVVEGSGQRHEITAAGSRLVAEGFV